MRSDSGIDIAIRNVLSLPTSPQRSGVFARAGGSLPQFDERLGVWIVLDPPTVTRLLQDARIRIPDFATTLGDLEARYAVSLPQLRWAATVVPLLLNGAAHRQARQALAKFLSGEKRREGTWRDVLPTMVAEAFARPGRIEAFGDLLVPLVNAIFSDVMGVRLESPPLSLTKIFDRYTSARQLADLEGRIGELREQLQARAVPADAEGVMVSLAILGRDSLLSSLGEALIDFMTHARGARLNEAVNPLPELFSGVAITERVVAEAFAFETVTFAKGDLIRLYFQGFNDLSEHAGRLGFFGSGGHSCLGRSLALEVWALLSAALRRSSHTVRAVEFEYDRSIIFAMPKYINVELGER